MFTGDTDHRGIFNSRVKLTNSIFMPTSLPTGLLSPAAKMISKRPKIFFTTKLILSLFFPCRRKVTYVFTS